MFAMAEDDRAFWGVVAANTFKHRSAVVHCMGEYVNGRIRPWDHLAIEPNIISSFCCHDCLPYAQIFCCKLLLGSSSFLIAVTSTVRTSHSFSI
ncbi:Uncharacterised protein [Vibrio cholerae]|uniref:Uncharacterized protein n=1 Tax=Vibrio cholerae TaxID=666 RepID=A0A656AWH1_VIBCL|nr:Uncharacterised protein [Vibrio cholerae]CSC57370.1 Uncharacterised protein [Vibrio cholerae]CSC91378.1 Uncharacterised protein [Vibrio cholerae]CSD04597.1 Uncharacterised protein [Vibrio cholerae]CSD45048.1 Uncharacterised protein [Vibrio cholerae]